MDSCTSKLLLLLLLGVMPLLLGTSVGIWLTLRRAAEDRIKRPELDRIHTLVSGLVQWADSFAGDMGEYGTHIAGICEQLSTEESASLAAGDNKDAGKGDAGKGRRSHPADADPSNRDVRNDNRRADENTLVAAADGPAPKRVDLIAELSNANNQLQQRLRKAETTLTSQAEELTAYSSEARTDVLTGLPNRRALDDELARRFSEWQRHGISLSVAIMDVDFFKRFNDTYGHLAGDVVLQGVARILANAVRGADMIARFGGEEFIAILPNTSALDASIPLERAREAVAEKIFSFEDNTLHVTISFGLAEAVTGEDIATLLKRTDAALYASKRAGRNCGHFHTGTRCKRVGSEPERDLVGASEGVSNAPSRQSQGFNRVCDDLRSRLSERLDG